MTASTEADRKAKAGNENTGLTDDFLRRTRDPVLLARAARIFRLGLARADAAAAEEAA